jgi:hypothetical protein
MVNDTLPSPTKVLNAFHKQRQQINQAQLTKPSAPKMSSPPPAKKARKSKSTPAAAATGGKPIDDLTALTTAQLYALSSRRHRDQSREAARLAQEERDRAHIALEQSQKLLERAQGHFDKMVENARDASKEYQDAKELLAKVRQSTTNPGSAVPLAVDYDDDDDILKILSSQKKKKGGGKGSSSGGTPGKKSQKFPYIEDLLISLAKSGQLHTGVKLHAASCNLVNKKDNYHFVNTMKLVEELWTEEEELFLRSSTKEIEESLEETKIIAETISLRCMTKLNEFEGREDSTPTNHQKPSFVAVGARARKVFHARETAAANLV